MCTLVLPDDGVSAHKTPAVGIVSVGFAWKVTDTFQLLVPLMGSSPKADVTARTWPGRVRRVLSLKNSALEPLKRAWSMAGKSASGVRVKLYQKPSRTPSLTSPWVVKSGHRSSVNGPIRFTSLLEFTIMPPSSTGSKNSTSPPEINENELGTLVLP